MNGSGKDRPLAQRPQRAVILSAGGLDGPELQAVRGQCVQVASAYEAAAEILRGPVAVLVVDLRLLQGRHLRLLQIARQSGVEVLAVGVLPPGLTGEDLSGVRLIARAELGEAITSLAPSESPKPTPVRLVEAKRPAVEQPEEPGRYEPTEKLARDSQQRLDEQAVAEILNDSEIEKLAARSAHSPIPKPAPAEPTPAKTKAPAVPAELLTPEELSALLENGP